MARIANSTRLATGRTIISFYCSGKWPILRPVTCLVSAKSTNNERVRETESPRHSWACYLQRQSKLGGAAFPMSKACPRQRESKTTRSLP